MEQNKPVGIWIRVSSEDQAKGDSPEHHERRARLYAESMGYEIKTVYHLEAHTGKSVMNYAETKRMLADVKKGFISGLIFSKLARFARNTKELLEFADIFQAENATLMSLEEAIDTGTPAGRLFYTVIAAMAQWEREEIASRVSASIPIRAKMGKSLGGIAPLGYKWEGKEFVIDEKHAPVRKLIYELFLKYRRKKAVAKHLNDAGYRSRTGTKFSDTTVCQLLRDPSAKGERRVNHSVKGAKTQAQKMKPESQWVMHPCPALVSEEVWNKCNEILDESLQKNKKPGPRAKHLLAGYVFCEDCGKNMYVFHATKSPTYRCAYGCSNRVVAKDLEEIFHDQLKTFLWTEASVAEYLETIDSQLSEKKNLLSMIQTERETIAKKMDVLIDLRMSGELCKDVFAEKYKPLEERFKQIDDQLPELQAEVDVLRIHNANSDVILSDAKNLYDQWGNLPQEDRRYLVERITNKIVVGKEDINIDLRHLPTTKPTHAAEPHPIDTSDLNGVKRQAILCGVS
jgi:site-specific DNA recombinase